MGMITEPDYRPELSAPIAIPTRQGYARQHLPPSHCLPPLRSAPTTGRSRQPARKTDLARSYTETYLPPIRVPTLDIAVTAANDSFLLRRKTSVGR